MISQWLKAATSATVATVTLAALSSAVSAQTVELRYGHMNPPNSAAGLQAQMLADEIAKGTGGGVKVTVYPSSQLGKLQELAAAHPGQNIVVVLHGGVLDIVDSLLFASPVAYAFWRFGMVG